MGTGQWGRPKVSEHVFTIQNSTLFLFNIFIIENNTSGRLEIKYAPLSSIILLQKERKKNTFELVVLVEFKWEFEFGGGFPFNL